MSVALFIQRANDFFWRKADIHRTPDVRKVPLTDSCAAANGVSKRQYFDRPRSKPALQVPQPKSDPSTTILQSYLKNRELQFKHRTSASNRLYCARCRTASQSTGAGVVAGRHPNWQIAGERFALLKTRYFGQTEFPNGCGKLALRAKP
jgi:hypothetical protein